MRSRGVSEVYFPGWGMTGRSWGAETCHCRMEQGECKSASDVAEGTAVGQGLSVFLGNETCKPLEGNRSRRGCKEMSKTVNPCAQ